jgi:sugar lactone lactonase YvrE
MVDWEGLIKTVAGTDPRKVESGAAPKYLWQPVGVAMGPDGQIYWADATLNRIKKADLSRIDPKINSGWVTIVAGSARWGFSGDGGPAREAELSAPAAVAFDSKGNLYLADHNNHRIRRVDAQTGIITTIAGNGQRGFSGDGGPATEASLNEPAALAFDTEDNLYIADAQNHRIRMVSARTGIITTVAGSGPSTEGPPIEGPVEKFFL